MIQNGLKDGLVWNKQIKYFQNNLRHGLRGTAISTPTSRQWSLERTAAVDIGLMLLYQALLCLHNRFRIRLCFCRSNAFVIVHGAHEEKRKNLFSVCHRCPQRYVSYDISLHWCHTKCGASLPSRDSDIYKLSGALKRRKEHEDSSYQLPVALEKMV